MQLSLPRRIVSDSPNRLDSLNRLDVLRVAVPLAVIALSAWIGQQGGNIFLLGFGGYELFVLASVTLVVIGIILHRLESGIFLVAAVGLTVPVAIGTGTASRLPASMFITVLLLGIWVLSMLLRQRVRLYPAPTNLPLLGFILISSISLPWSYLFWRPGLFVSSSGTTPFILIQIAGLALMILLPLRSLAALNILQDLRWAKGILGVIIAVACVGALVNFHLLPSDFGPLKINTGGMFSLWAISLLYAQLLFNDKLATWQRVAMLAIIAAWIFNLLILGVSWISGWAPPLLAILFLTFLKSRKVAIALAVLGVFVALARWDWVYAKIWLQSSSEDFNRLTIWTTVISLVFTHASVWFGAGPVGYIPLFSAFITGRGWSSHSNYIDIIAETGVLGTLFFVWFLAAAVFRGTSNHLKLEDGFVRALNNGVLGGLLGMMMAMLLGDWFIPFVYNVGYAGFDWNAFGWILIGVMLGLNRFSKPRTAAAADTPNVDA